MVSLSSAVNLSRTNGIRNLEINQVIKVRNSDDDPHGSYAEPDQKNLVNAVPDPGQKISLNIFQTIFSKSTRKQIFSNLFINLRDTVCPGSSDLFYIGSYYIKWVTTSWIHS